MPITAFLIGVDHGVAAELIGATLAVLALPTNGIAPKFFQVRWQPAGVTTTECER